MEENFDLEEGEAVSSINEDIDPDIDLLYIDEKLQDVLGHFQKDFEGWGASADQLGPKFGAYGSFLPIYERSPVVALCQKSSERKHSVQRCSNSLPLKDGDQDFRPLTERFQSMRPSTANHLAHSSCNSRVPAGVAPAIQASSLLSAQASGKESLKERNLSISSNKSTAKKPLKVRIKMGSAYVSQKAATIYSGLGLNTSPSLSPDNSRDEGGGMLPPISQEATSDSPSVILRDMTSFPVPGGVLISPLHASLLSLMSQQTEKKLKDGKAVKNSSDLPSAMPQNKSFDVLVIGKILNEKKKVKLVKKNDKYKKQAPHSSSVEKALKKSLVDSYTDALGDQVNSGNCRTDQTAVSHKESSFFEDSGKTKNISVGEKTKKSLTLGLGGRTASYSVSASKDILQKDATKARENCLDPLRANSDVPEVSGDMGKYPDLFGSEKKHKASAFKSREKFSGKKFHEKPVAVTPIKDVTYTSQHNIEDGRASEVLSCLATVELDNWAQCDTCETWRLLPPGVVPDELPDKWVCSMQSWLPSMNYCGIGQDETANAVKALFQIPGTEAQKNPQSSVNGLASDVCHLEQSRQHLTPQSLSNRIKKSALDTVSKGGCGNALAQRLSCTKTNLHESVKGKSMMQRLAKHGIIDKSGPRHLVTSCDSGGDKHVLESKEKHFSRDVVVQIKMKDTRVDNQTTPGFRSLGTETCNKMNGPLKKRKLMDWEDNQDWSDLELYSKRESKESQHKERNAKISRVECKELVTKKGNNRSSKSSIAKQFLQSGAGIYHNDGYDEKRSFDSSWRDLLYGQVSGAATSSSSKVIGSRKTEAANLEEVKASPIESVSSSPMRISCPEKLASAQDRISHKDSTPNGGVSKCGNISFRRVQDLEGAGEFESIAEPRIENKSKAKEYDHQSPELGHISCMNVQTSLQRKQIQGCGSESKADPLPLPASGLECRFDRLPTSSSANSNDLNVLKQPGHDSTMKVAEVKKFNASILGSMDTSSLVANNILKEAQKLRNDADHFKSSGFNFEFKEISFKAALKFLHGASLLETCHGENVRHGEMNHMEVYGTAAKLFESCAHEYETCNEMAAAALSYKCMAVAYMRMVYCKSLSTSSDLEELQTTLQMVLPGESPSSSVSDVDNLNHQGTMDRPALTRGAFPHIAGNHVIVARSSPNFARLLDFTQTVNFAMEASRKSQSAFEAASVALDMVQNRDCIASMKRTINFGFQDVEALLLLVEVAMDAISHSGFGGP